MELKTVNTLQTFWKPKKHYQMRLYESIHETKSQVLRIGFASIKQTPCFAVSVF